MDNSIHPEAVDTVSVEITYALPEKQTLYRFDVPVGTSINTGIELSGIKAIHPELDLDTMKVGIFGKIAPRERILEEKDRIELYRPLFADPKEIRKQRAAEGKTMKNRQKAKGKQQ
jgi:putative ubiquitin-RnfH superfamily antitoxin RatB of RatAB toxin-antitoxin module